MSSKCHISEWVNGIGASAGGISIEVIIIIYCALLSLNVVSLQSDV